MAQGMIVRDASGRTIVDVTDRLMRRVALVRVGSAQATPDQFGNVTSGFMPFSGMTRNGLWLIVPGFTFISVFLGPYQANPAVPCTCVAGNNGFSFAIDGNYTNSTWHNDVTIFQL